MKLHFVLSVLSILVFSQACFSQVQTVNSGDFDIDIEFEISGSE